MHSSLRDSPPDRAAGCRRGRVSVGAVFGTAFAIAFAVGVGLIGPRLGDRPSPPTGAPLAGVMLATAHLHREAEIEAPRDGERLERGAWRGLVAAALGASPGSELADPELLDWRARAVVVRPVTRSGGLGPAVTVLFEREGPAGRRPPARMSVTYIADGGAITVYDRFGRIRPLGDDAVIRIDPEGLRGMDGDGLAALVWVDGPLVAVAHAVRSDDLRDLERWLLESGYGETSRDDDVDGDSRGDGRDGDPAGAPDLRR